MQARSRALAALALTGALLGCATDPTALTRVVVWIEAEPMVRARADQVRIEVRRQDGSIAFDEHADATFPIKVVLAPRSEDADRRYMLTAEALDGAGTVVALARLQSSFVAARTRHVRLVLEDACLRIACASSAATCHDGECVSASVDARRFGDDASRAPNAADLPKSDEQLGEDAAVPPDPGSNDGGLADSGADASVTPPAPCDEPDARDCGSDGNTPRLCDGILWQEASPCGMDERCDDSSGSTRGTCLPIATECEGMPLGRAFCGDTSTLRTCDSSVRFEDEACPDNGECRSDSQPARCVCLSGFTKDGRTCVDINECEQGNGGCDSLARCENTAGSHACGACPDDYLGSGEQGCAPTLISLSERFPDTLEWPIVAPTLDPADPDAARTLVGLETVLVDFMATSPPDAVISIGGEDVPSGSWWRAPALATGENVFPVVVSQAGHPSLEYTIRVVRGAQAAYVKASNAETQDGFGQAVAVSPPVVPTPTEEGTTIAVGAPWEDSNATGIGGNQGDNSADDSGAVYVVVLDSDSTWRQQAYVKASNAGAGDRFGMRLAVAGDLLVSGAPGEDSDAPAGNEGATDSGAVYTFTRGGGTWTQDALLKADNAAAGDGFGDSVAISGDTLVVGAPGEDSAATGVDGDGADDSEAESGAAYVFIRTSGTWTQQAYLKASNTGAGDRFGRSVAIAGDWLVVGAVGEASASMGVDGDEGDDSAADAGAAYLFERVAGVWMQRAYLKASNTGEGDAFGYRVAMSGTTVAVSAPFEDSAFADDELDGSSQNAGALYVFERGAGSVVQEAYLKAAAPQAFDWFGIGVALEGDRVLVGAADEGGGGRGFGQDDDTVSIERSGAVYVFDRSVGVFEPFAYAKADNPGIGDQFGYNVALSGRWLVVGARGEASDSMGITSAGSANDDAPSAGAVYILY